MSKYPEHSYVKTKTYYQGKEVSAEFFNSNPEIFKDYPSFEQVQNVKKQVELTRQPEARHTIVISEYIIGKSKNHVFQSQKYHFDAIPRLKRERRSNLN